MGFQRATYLLNLNGIEIDLSGDAQKGYIKKTEGPVSS